MIIFLRQRIQEVTKSLGSYGLQSDPSGDLRLNLPQNLGEKSLGFSLTVSPSVSQLVGGEECYLSRRIKLFDDGLGNIKTAVGSNGDQKLPSAVSIMRPVWR